jgi:hypothetical protein
LFGRNISLCPSPLVQMRALHLLMAAKVNIQV